jgi:opacity protein-like surface antigen
VTLARDARIRWDWSARAKIGIASGADLFYGTGGIAQTKMRLTGEDTFLTPAGAAASNIGGVPTFNSPTIGPVVTRVSQEATMTGWTAGIGGEHRIGRHFSLGLDARYVDYGSRTIAFPCGFVTIRSGTCATGSYSTPPIVINGTPRGPTDTTPRAEPDPTRVRLSEMRVALRLIFRI